MWTTDRINDHIIAITLPFLERMQRVAAMHPHVVNQFEYARSFLFSDNCRRDEDELMTVQLPWQTGQTGISFRNSTALAPFDFAVLLIK